jgi:putative nucleotidyltransferase with HDIG domain
MGLSNEEIELIACAAYLHDIGKIRIPPQILSKPRRLKPDEVAVTQEHCACGYRMLQEIPIPAEAAEIVYSHHEHYDGNGYPRALVGQQIPLGARIIAVADTFDSISSDHRPYRVRRPVNDARAEILRCAGTQFDPQVVEAFLAIPDAVWSDLIRQIQEEP